MSLRLEVVAGIAIGEELSIDDGLVFGRLGISPAGWEAILSSPARHAEVTLAPSGQYSIEDLSSMNGTYLNGERLEGPATLAAGDVIDLGATKLIVREAPGPPSPAPAPVEVRAASTIVDVIPGMPLTPSEAPPAVPLQIRLVVDFEARQAEIGFPGWAAPIRLRHQDGRWRVTHQGS